MKLEVMRLRAVRHGRLVKLFATFVADSNCMKGEEMTAAAEHHGKKK